MIPYIITPWGNIYTFPICIVLGILALLLSLHKILKNSTDNYINEENYIFPKIVICGLFGYFTSGLFDSLVKLRLYGEFKLTGITFYGGLIGVILSLFLLLKTTRKATLFSTKEWFDFLTLPFIMFHIFGRIGCFLGGCCYGKVTNSSLGIVFPDNAIQGIFHYGEKRYPTQIFEVLALIIIFIILFKNKNKFINYIFLYATARFVIEFFRGDERGKIIDVFSPSQVVSIILFTIVIICKGRTFLHNIRHNKHS